MELPSPNILSEQNRTAYDALASIYERAWANTIDTAIVDVFCRFVPVGARILDVGCGPGHYAAHFQTLDRDAYAIDFSQGMLEKARHRVDASRLARMDMRRLGFADRSFDALWACASLVHIPEIQVQETLREFRRLLRPPHAVLFVGVQQSSAAQFRVETKEEMGALERPGRFFQYYTGDEHFVSHLEAAQFEVIDVVNRVIESTVLPKATCKTNHWLNYLCRVA